MNVISTILKKAFLKTKCNPCLTNETFKKKIHVFSYFIFTGEHITSIFSLLQKNKNEIKTTQTLN